MATYQGPIFDADNHFYETTESLTRHLPPPTYSRLFGMDEVLAQLVDFLDARDRHWVISLDGMARRFRAGIWKPSPRRAH